MKLCQSTCIGTRMFDLTILLSSVSSSISIQSHCYKQNISQKNTPLSTPMESNQSTLHCRLEDLGNFQTSNTIYRWQLGSQKTYSTRKYYVMLILLVISKTGIKELIQVYLEKRLLKQCACVTLRACLYVCVYVLCATEDDLVAWHNA